MKSVYAITLSVLLTLLTNIAISSNYYFSVSMGDDSRTSAQAKNPLTPWKTLSKLNSSMSILLPGDSVLFKRGDEFYGQINVTASGSIGNYIHFAAYGSGSKPVINGGVALTGWVNQGSNIWESNCPNCPPVVNNFFINGVHQQIGRYPNADAPYKGYLSIDSHVGSSQLSSANLSSNNWTGAEAVVRTSRWLLDRVNIQSHLGNTLVFSSNTTMNMIDGWGFFIQNHPSTLDKNGEWYYNPTAKKVRIYETTNPNNQKTEVPVLESVLTISSQKYIEFNGLGFRNSNSQTVAVDNCQYISFSNNAFYDSGKNGLAFSNCNTISFTGNFIVNSNNNSFNLNGCTGAMISDNTIKKSGIYAGMGNGGNGEYFTVSLSGTNILFKNNVVDSVGYIGVSFAGNSISIINNLISDFCMVKDDGGGIYAWSDNVSAIYTNRKLIGNILFNGIGAGAGTGDTNSVAVEGIYMDDRTNNVEIDSNTVANCGSRGIFIHNANSIQVNRNTLFNNGEQFLMQHDNIDPGSPIHNCSVKNNIFFSKSPFQTVGSFSTRVNDIGNFGLMDSNYYCRPFNKEDCITHANQNGSLLENLASWKLAYNKDKNSQEAPVTYKYYSIKSFTGANQFANGTFDSNTSGWYCWASNSNCQVNWDNTNTLKTGGSISASFTSAGGYMLLVGNIGSVSSSKKYILRFNSYSSVKQVATISLRQDYSPYHILASQINITMDTINKYFEFLIIPSSNDNNMRIDFFISNNNGTAWFDNIELREADVNYASLNDSILFFHNPTQILQKFTLPAGKSYIDVKRNVYSSSVQLAPYASIILLYKQQTATGVIVSSTEEISFSIYPNPVNQLAIIRYSLTENSNVKFSIVDVLGKEIMQVKNEKQCAGEYQLNVNTEQMQTGIYFVNMNVNGEQETQKLIVNK